MKSDGLTVRVEWLDQEVFGKSDCSRSKDEPIGDEISKSNNNAAEVKSETILRLNQKQPPTQHLSDR